MHVVELTYVVELSTLPCYSMILGDKWERVIIDYPLSIITFKS